MNVNFKMFVEMQHYSNLSGTVNYSTQTSCISPQLSYTITATKIEIVQLVR